MLEKVCLTEKYDNITIMGDLNINLDSDNVDTDLLNSDLKNSLLDTFPLAGLKHTVTDCTRRVQNQRPSLIDQSWTSNMNKLMQTINVELVSDHNILLY